MDSQLGLGLGGWAAWLAEKDEAIAPRCKERYMQAKEVLDSFRMTWVAGGEGTHQGCHV